jgi:tight adherence protein B
MSTALLFGLAICAVVASLVVERRPEARGALLAGLAIAGSLATVGVGAPTSLVAGVLGGALGGRRAHRLERRRAGRVRVRIERALPDALDLLAGLVESGAPLGPALASVAQRVDGPLRVELEACASALGTAGSRRAAFGLLRQSGSADLARVGQALALADELGTGVAEQLRGQALVQRDLRRSRAREQAGAAAPKIALVIGLLLVPAALSLVLGAELLSALSAARGT